MTFKFPNDVEILIRGMGEGAQPFEARRVTAEELRNIDERQFREIVASVAAKFFQRVQAEPNA